MKSRIDNIATQGMSGSPPTTKSPRSWAQVVKACGEPPLSLGTVTSSTPAAPIISPPAEREITIKINDSTMAEAFRNLQPSALRERINATLKESNTPTLTNVCIPAAKRLESGDIRIHTATKADVEVLKHHLERWVPMFGQAARVTTHTYGVRVDSVPTSSMDLDSPQIIQAECKKMMAANHANIPNCQITYIAWLTLEGKKKRFTSMRVEFSTPWDANKAIAGNIFWEGLALPRKRYNRSRRLKQCFKCCKYGHIGSQSNTTPQTRENITLASRSQFSSSLPRTQTQKKRYRAGSSDRRAASPEAGEARKRSVSTRGRRISHTEKGQSLQASQIARTQRGQGRPSMRNRAEPIVVSSSRTNQVNNAGQAAPNDTTMQDE